ncbi:hypothetical protein [Candidatus Fokinia solitaria]|nr:hypothetical protein [Candidatus Fokinia solitaria]
MIDRVPGTILIEVEHLYSLSIGLKLSILILSEILKGKEKHTLELMISHFLNNFGFFFDENELNNLLNHPDLMVISSTYSNKQCTPKAIESISMEDVKQAEHFMSLTQYGKKKVLLLHDISTMSISAANALLKTLEDVPRDAIILMTVSKRTMVQETILSRCIIFKLATAPLKEVKNSVDASTFEKIEVIFKLCEKDLNSVNDVMSLLRKEHSIGYAGTMAKNIIFAMDTYSENDSATLLQKTKTLLHLLQQFTRSTKVEKSVEEEKILQKSILFFTHEILIQFSCKLFHNTKTEVDYIQQMQNFKISKLLSSYTSILNLNYKHLDRHTLLHVIANKCVQILNELLQIVKA